MKNLEAQQRSLDCTSQSLLLGLKGESADECWCRFVELYEPMLRGWAEKHSLDDSQVREAISDVYVKLVENLPKFVYDPSKRFRSWLRTVLERAIIDLRRRNKRVLSLPNDEIELRASPKVSKHVDDCDQFVSDLEQRVEMANQIVQRVRKRVSEKSWNVFYRTEIENDSGVDVARELGMTEGAIYTARFRVRAVLREEMMKTSANELS